MTEVDPEGLRRKDALILVALLVRQRERESDSPGPRAPFWRRALFTTRWRLRGRLRRLERRGLIEPGWRLSLFRHRNNHFEVTPLGVRTAKAAVVTLGLEEGVRYFDG